MIILNGKYNFAKVFLPDKEHTAGGTAGDSFVFLDALTKEQIISFLNHPAFRGRKIRIMPDVHYGKGSCVGFTMDFGSHIIPNIVGVDIGCGIDTWNLGQIYLDGGVLAGLDEFIKKNIPHGFAVHGNQTSNIMNSDLRDSVDWWSGRLEMDYGRVINSIGTLGGGNHFIELGKDEEGNVWVTVHSGSRNFGLQVAKHFQAEANEQCAGYFQDFGDLNFLHESSDAYAEYLDAMNTAQQFAELNRSEMLSKIAYEYFHVEVKDVVNSVHNYIDLDANIIRKGATDASEGKRLVIPFNMEEGFIIGKGKGNADWNNSAPHGAGRILSRNKAKEALDLQKSQADMEQAGIYTTTLTEGSLDEAKGAYKDKELILSMIEPTVEVLQFVKPVYNFKDDSKRGKK